MGSYYISCQDLAWISCLDISVAVTEKLLQARTVFNTHHIPYVCILVFYNSELL